MPKLESIIDEGKKVKHSKLSDMVEEVVSDPTKVWPGVRVWVW